jgi:hypothetical protein
MENRQSNRHIKQHRIKVVRLRVWSGTQWHIMPFNFHCWWIIFSYDQHILIIPASTPLWFTQQQTSTLLIVDKYLSSWWFQPPLKKKSWEYWIFLPNIWKKVPNHQPVTHPFWLAVFSSGFDPWQRNWCLAETDAWTTNPKSCVKLYRIIIYIYHHIYIMYIYIYV